MTDEEKKAIEYLKQNDIAEIQYDNYGLESIHRIGIDEKYIILNLIEKQQKEIEKLKEVNKEHQKLNGELRDEIKRQGNTREIEEKYIEENFISKDKIREKIELLLKANKLMTEEQRQKETEYMQGKLRAYEELLEEE